MPDYIEASIKINKRYTVIHSVIAAIAAFSTYSCMYAYRKAFTAATFEGIIFLHLHYKVWLIIAQLLGYTFSKFYGIKFISESISKNRALLIIVFILTSWLALLGFALIPAPYNIVCMFLNGFPLGMVWGLVFSYLEGRKSTEFLGAVLCVSFIFASGFVKSTGTYLMYNFHVTEYWMPFATGFVFFIPLLISVYILQRTPPPSHVDIQLRTQRKSISKEARIKLLKTYSLGIVLLVVTYVILTITRDFRDNFASEIWKENNVVSANIFTKTEILVSVAILAMMSLLMFINNNKKALFINHVIIISGFVFTILTTYLFYIKMLSAVSWMVCSGIGLYMGYVPFNCILFDRLIAYLEITGTVGFLIYLADSFGYLGSFSVLVIKELFSLEISWTNFFTYLFFISSLIGIVSMICSWIYFRNQKSVSHE